MGNSFARRQQVASLIAVILLSVAAISHAAITLFPDVLRAEVRMSGRDTFDFDVTVSSRYDSPARYADAFRVTTKAGQVLGERILTHDHADEQPFTRDLYGVKIPQGIKVVSIQARDQLSGYGGKSIDIVLPGR
jgi:hypothetical protein